jgi:hypothetical protein
VQEVCRLSVKKKAPTRPAWTGYWLLRRTPFPDERWLLRWNALKEELRLKLPSL